MTQDEIFDAARKSHLDVYALGRDKSQFIYRLEAFAKLVAAKEREIYDHDTTVLMNALWKSCGDDEEVVQDTIDSQGTLIRGKA